MKPALFGITNSNRNFELKNSWGKNQFNSSFPTSLCAYFEHRGLKANYIIFKNGKTSIDEVYIKDLLGISSKDAKIFYSFESQFSPYAVFVDGILPRTDLVVLNEKTKTCLRGLEIKLTAMPDESTYNRAENEYGCELVIRPDSICYLACSLLSSIKELNLNLRRNFSLKIEDFTNPDEILLHAKDIMQSLSLLTQELSGHQTPFLLQPIWKTKGKSPILADCCLDIFAWSDVGFLSYMLSIANFRKSNSVTRQFRSCVWVYKMLSDFYVNKLFSPEHIFDKFSFNLKNDKAFSSPGNINRAFMACDNLLAPRIAKSEIKKYNFRWRSTFFKPRETL